MTARGAYDEVYVYAMGRPGFLLQYVVDAYAAHQANAATKPITLVFALVGLHLHVERGLSGRAVQRFHIRMGRERREWPRIDLPQTRGGLTAEDVLEAAAGAQRDEAIEAWCREVWNAYAESHEVIADLVDAFSRES